MAYGRNFKFVFRTLLAVASVFSAAVLVRHFFNSKVDLDKFNKLIPTPASFEFQNFTAGVDDTGKKLNSFTYKAASKVPEEKIREYESQLAASGFHCLVPAKSHGWFFSKKVGTTECKCKAQQYSKWKNESTHLTYEIYYGIFADCTKGPNCGLAKNWGDLVELFALVSQD